MTEINSKIKIYFFNRSLNCALICLQKFVCLDLAFDGVQKVGLKIRCFGRPTKSL